MLSMQVALEGVNIGAYWLFGELGVSLVHFPHSTSFCLTPFLQKDNMHAKVTCLKIPPQVYYWKHGLKMEMRPFGECSNHCLK